MSCRRPPNIVWITCDELRADALDCYGNRVTSMAAAGRLAREGVRVEHAYCQMPKCVPSRCSMLTGRYPHADGFRTLRGRLHSPPWPGTADNSMVCLQHDTPNLVSHLRGLGYGTALHGKNHVVEWNLHEAWFDSTSSWRWDKPGRGAVPELWARAEYHGPVQDDFRFERHADAVIATEAIAYLERARDRPFFLLVDMHLPHPVYQDYPTPVAKRPLEDIPAPPLRAPEAMPWLERALREVRSVEALTDDDRRRIRRAYYSMAEFADLQVGRILEALDRLGLTENTLVIYTSDHGDFAGDHNCFEKWDTSFLDCIVRVPLLLRLPGRLPAGRVCSTMVELVDVLPTVLDLAGFATPGWVQGRSFAGVARGEADRHRDNVLCSGGVEESLTRRGVGAETPGAAPLKQSVLLHSPGTLMRAKMIRTLTHKYIHRLHGGSELYDLTADPHELDNRSGDPGLREVESELRGRLLERLIESETILPEIGALYA